MEIVGDGFLARHLRSLGTQYPGTVAIAAGVSRPWASADDFSREADLVREVAARCRVTGQMLLFFSTSSAAVYAADRPGRESDPEAPRSDYGEHKLVIERVLRDSGTPHLILRLAHVVGPGQRPHQLIPAFVGLMRAGEEVRIQRAAARDLIAVSDVVTIIEALLARGVRDETVNVASGFTVPVTRIVDHLEGLLGCPARRKLVDGGEAHLVSTEKLRLLVPETEGFGFGLHYPMRAIDCFVDEEAGRLNTGREG